MDVRDLRKFFTVLLITWLVCMQAAIADTANDPGVIVSGSPITSSQLNARFSPLYLTVNGLLSNGNIKVGAAIDPTKLDATKAYPLLLQAAATYSFRTGNTGDTQPRWGVTTDGKLFFGVGGATAPDVMVKRYTDASTLIGLALRDSGDTAFKSLTARDIFAEGNGVGSNGYLRAGGTNVQGILKLFSSSGKFINVSVPNGLANDSAVNLVQNGSIGGNNLATIYTGPDTAPVVPQPLMTTGSTANFPTYTGGGFNYKAIDKPYEFGGRLSLGATPVTAADTTGTTISYLPSASNYVSIYNVAGTTWGMWDITSIAALNIPAVANQMYDLFVGVSSGAAVLSAVAWTSDIARATALTTQDGVLVSSANKGLTYLGSFRTNTTPGQCEDSAARRYLFNYYNRVNRSLFATEPTASWAYNVATWRSPNGAAATSYGVCSTAFVIGVQDTLVTSEYHACYSNTAAVITESSIGIALDSSTPTYSTTLNNPQVNMRSSGSVRYAGYPSPGWHYLANLEIRGTNSATNTWYGIQPTTLTQENYQSGFLLM